MFTSALNGRYIEIVHFEVLPGEYLQMPMF